MMTVHSAPVRSSARSDVLERESDVFIGEEHAPARGRSPSICAPFASLLDVFQSEHVNYCYWKGTRRVSRVLSGNSDLDLLIERADRPRAAIILDRLGFKHWPDAPGRDQPALMSYLCYDGEGERFCHVHLHFRLVLGHALLKNFRFPAEEAFLSRSVLHSSLPIRVLDPTDEALLLIVRANLEMSPTDAVAARRWRELERKYADDLAHVVVQAEAVRSRAAELFSPATASAIAERLSIEQPRERRLRRAIMQELSTFRMYGGVESAARSGWRALLWGVGALNERHFSAPRLMRRRAPGGGVLIAFVGVDGSGKSTQVGEARRWLGTEIDVLRLYFGSGDGRASLLFRPFKAASRIAAAMIRVKPKGASHGQISDRPPGLFYSTLFAIWAIAVALDKHAKLIAAQRAIARGFVVVTDRYPQDEILEFNDGPLLHRLPHAPSWLKRVEASVYAASRRAPPDLVIKLRVGPAAVARREPNMNGDIILQRVKWLSELRFPGSRMITIDGERPREEVTSIARKAIWDIL
jgi:hypothetical protein